MRLGGRLYKLSEGILGSPVQATCVGEIGQEEDKLVGRAVLGSRSGSHGEQRAYADDEPRAGELQRVEDDCWSYEAAVSMLSRKDNGGLGPEA